MPPEGQPPLWRCRAVAVRGPSGSPTRIGVLRLKWLEQRHMRQIRRWNERHTEELQAAWLNGSGIMVWSVSSQPGTEDRAALRRAAPIARRFAGHFSEKLVAARRAHSSIGEGLGWERDGVRLWTLVNLAPEPLDERCSP